MASHREDMQQRIDEAVESGEMTEEEALERLEKAERRMQGRHGGDHSRPPMGDC